MKGGQCSCVHSAVAKVIVRFMTAPCSVNDCRGFRELAYSHSSGVFNGGRANVEMIKYLFLGNCDVSALIQALLPQPGFLQHR